MAYSIDIINTICTDLGGTGGHKYEINALNEICSLVGATNGHKYNIDALNAICAAMGYSAGHKYNIDALNAIYVGGTYIYEDDAWQAIQIGSTLNLPPSLIYDGNTVAWYKFDDFKTLYKDTDQKVCEWKDKLGSFHDLILETDTNAVALPLWTVDGIVFDGVNDFMKTLPFTLAQPITVYMLMKNVTWSSQDRLIDGNANDSMGLFQNPSTPNLSLNAGTILINNSDNNITGFKIIRCVFNGANSALQIDELTRKTGNAGTANAGGITVARLGTAAAGYGNIIVKELIVRKVVDSDETIIYNYLKKIKDTPAVSKSGLNNIGGTLFFGNSYARHQLASFWWGTWGMAATSRAKDYVHVLMDKFNVAGIGNGKFDVVNIAAWEANWSTFNLSFFDDYLANKPAKIIIRVGENVSVPTGYQAAFGALLDYFILKSPTSQIICASTFVVNYKSDYMKAECLSRGLLWVDLTALGTISGNKSSIGAVIVDDWGVSHTNASTAVADHPSDQGMQAIADAIFNAITAV